MTVSYLIFPVKTLILIKAPTLMIRLWAII